MMLPRFSSVSAESNRLTIARVIRILRDDLVRPREFDSVQAFEAEQKHWVKDYDEDFPHSALNDETPCDYERLFHASLS